MCDKGEGDPAPWTGLLPATTNPAREWNPTVCSFCSSTSEATSCARITCRKSFVRHRSHGIRRRRTASPVCRSPSPGEADRYAGVIRRRGSPSAGSPWPATARTPPGVPSRGSPAWRRRHRASSISVIDTREAATGVLLYAESRYSITSTAAVPRRPGTTTAGTSSPRRPIAAPGSAGPRHHRTPHPP